MKKNIELQKKGILYPNNFLTCKELKQKERKEKFLKSLEIFGNQFFTMLGFGLIILTLGFNIYLFSNVLQATQSDLVLFVLLMNFYILGIFFYEFFKYMLSLNKEKKTR